MYVRVKTGGGEKKNAGKPVEMDGGLHKNESGLLQWKFSSRVRRTLWEHISNVYVT